MHILLVDDHPLFREALRTLLAAKLPAASLETASTLGIALERARRQPPDLMLVDLALPDASGLQSLQALHEAVPGARAIVVSGDDRPQTVYAALDAGAAGFIHKAAESDGIVQALGTVLEGGIALPASLVERPAQPTAREQLGLSERQWQVLQRVLEGKPNKLICRELDLSPSTVKTHLAEVFRRLDVRSRTQAMVEVARRGIRLH